MMVGVLIFLLFANFVAISCDPTLNPAVVKMYNIIKLTQNAPKYMLFGINPLNKQEIIITKNGTVTATYDVFLKELDQVGKARDCTFAVLNFNCTDPITKQTKTKMVYYLWVPDAASTSKKIAYTASNDYVKRSLIGVSIFYQASTLDEISYAKVTAKCLKI